jgi:hypothetical protein
LVQWDTSDDDWLEGCGEQIYRLLICGHGGGLNPERQRDQVFLDLDFRRSRNSKLIA